METIASPLSSHETIIFRLRELFGRYGYSRCRVSTFEEYDFYSRNRSIFSGEDVLTFTDADGRLMALKPDVTMSIVKNMPDRISGLQKICYNENIYRIPPAGAGFRESVQTGLECIGELNAYAVGEVIMLAAESLRAINPDFILDLSHIDILEGLLDQALGDSPDRQPILKALEEKNLSALRQLCRRCGMAESYAQSLESLCCLYGPLQDTLAQVEAAAVGEKMQKACRQLRILAQILEVCGISQQVHLDFSIRGGTDYYSGFLLRGFVAGAASPVLWGGQYDTLLQKMGKDGGGIGFAVYLDQLEHQTSPAAEDDILLLYGQEASPAQVMQAVKRLEKEGRRVRAERQIPEGVRYSRLMKLEEAESLE